MFNYYIVAEERFYAVNYLVRAITRSDDLLHFN